jgi:exopolyphosphatase / guanosine-5'-triphosphate,3'-diphosphate pyrophosphatase
MRVAAIDVGSNSVRLLVADVGESPGKPGQLETIARAGEVCRLARGLDRTGRIEPELAERAGALVSEFSRRARSLGAVHIVAGATAAIRKASNGDEVAAIISGRSGLPIRILTGEDEARLVYRSVVSGLGAMASRSSCVVFDIGGGSTEVVSGLGAQVGRWASLPFGAVSLTERHFTSDPPTPEALEQLSREVRDGLMHHCALMPTQTPLLAGVGGTVTVLASLDRGIEAYEPSLIEGWIISRARLDDLTERLIRANQEERRLWSIIGEGRADIIAAGALVVRLLLERFPSAGLVCSTQGLRYGLVRTAAEEARAGAAPGTTGEE